MNKRVGNYEQVKPENLNHCITNVENNQIFHLWKLNCAFKGSEPTWEYKGKREIKEIGKIICRNEKVFSAKVVDDRIDTGALMEIELRISINGTYFTMEEMNKHPKCSEFL